MRTKSQENIISKTFGIGPGIKHEVHRIGEEVQKVEIDTTRNANQRRCTTSRGTKLEVVTD